jgi:hypothetical protein
VLRQLYSTAGINASESLVGVRTCTEVDPPHVVMLNDVAQGIVALTVQRLTA